MSAMFDCLCAGIVVADTVCHPLACPPRPGSLTRTERVEFNIGGCAANVAGDMARLGLRVGISGRVGNDVFGREVRDLLVKAKVDCSGLVLSDTAPTSTTFVLNVRGQDRSFIHCVGANVEYDGRQLSENEIRETKILYVGGFGLLESLTPDNVARLFRIARDAKVPTVLNVVLPESGDLSSWVTEVAPWTDYFFPNEDEAKRLTAESDPRKQASHLRALGIRNVVITKGDKGSLLLGESGCYEADIFPVDVVDGTGTGDAFAAGFMFGLLREAGPVDCLRFGSAMGASCVRSMGATTGVFTQSELLEFLNKNPLRILRLD